MYAFVLLQFTNTLLRTALLTPVMFIVSLIMILKTSPSLSVVLSHNYSIYNTWSYSYSKDI